MMSLQYVLVLSWRTRDTCLILSLTCCVARITTYANLHGLFNIVSTVALKQSLPCFRPCDYDIIRELLPSLSKFTNSVQVDTSGCFQGLVDIKTKVDIYK